ncbi:MAG: PAS domain S-box protein, partial [Ilumatobacteraceae bacterium]
MGERRKISPAAVVELADGAVVVGANAAAAAILGVTPAELIGRTIGLVDQRGQQSTGDVGNADVLDLFADLSALALFSQDADGRIVRWNRGAERIFGHSEDEIVGGTLPSLAPAHLRADLESVRQRVATGERVDR